MSHSARRDFLKLALGGAGVLLPGFLEASPSSLAGTCTEGNNPTARQRCANLTRAECVRSGFCHSFFTNTINLLI